MRLFLFAFPLLFAASLSACKRDQAATQDAPKETSTAAAATTSTPAASAPAAPDANTATTSSTATAGASFDLQSVPMTGKALPAFPYVAVPPEVDKNYINIDKDLEFDRISVLAGEEVRRVEGRILHRRFSLDQLKWSALAAHRNYETALKNLGAVRVDKTHPANKQFVERNGGDQGALATKMGLPYLNPMEDAEIPGFEQWLIRTPETNIWISFYIFGGELNLLTVEEKAMKQMVQATPGTARSGAMRQESQTGNRRVELVRV